MSAKNNKSKTAYVEMQKMYGQVPVQEAEVIVVLSGDGTLLRAIHEIYHYNVPIYGLNRGDVGFLTNEYDFKNFEHNLKSASKLVIHPLYMKCRDVFGKTFESVAINEVYLLRQSHQAAKLQISIDNVVRMKKLICDGLIISSTIGSTAYNFSAYGPIIPIGSKLVAMTPISVFRPRNWRGALLKSNSEFLINVLYSKYRPVCVVADYVEFKDIEEVLVYEDVSKNITLLLNSNNFIDEKILAEQFAVN